MCIRFSLLLKVCIDSYFWFHNYLHCHFISTPKESFQHFNLLLTRIFGSFSCTHRTTRFFAKIELFGKFKETAVSSLLLVNFLRIIKKFETKKDCEPNCARVKSNLNLPYLIKLLRDICVPKTRKKSSKNRIYSLYSTTQTPTWKRIFDAQPQPGHCINDCVIRVRMRLYNNNILSWSHLISCNSIKWKQFNLYTFILYILCA